ncbi:SGNH/GDSL hydrolase family protein, partial [Bacteroidota bacterium]
KIIHQLIIFPLLFIALLVPLNQPNAQTKTEFISTDTVTALFIGNSLTGFNQMPKTVEELGKAAGKDIYCEGKIVAGTSVIDICNFEDTRAKILERDWTYVVIQGDIHSTAFPDNHHLIMPWLPYKPIKPMLFEMKEFIADNKPGTQLIFFMPWAYEDGMTWVAGETDTYETMQQKVYDNALIFADDVGIPVAPVGWAWNYVWYDESTFCLFQPDFVHPNDKGSYLAACVFYSVFFMESCRYNYYYKTLNQIEAEYLQDIASSIVMDDLELWNLTTSTGTEYIAEIPRDFILFQNYPNPFNPSTNISFQIPNEGIVSIKIFDALGNEVTELLNRQMSAGLHEVEFNAFGLSSGTYFYQIRHKDDIRTKKMIILK